jgi:hypothetical protein
MKAVELLGNVPNATAKNLRTLRSGKLLVTVPVATRKLTDVDFGRNESSS